MNKRFLRYPADFTAGYLAKMAVLKLEWLFFLRKNLKKFIPKLDVRKIRKE